MKTKRKTYAIHISEELDYQFQKAFKDGFQAFRHTNIFIRYLATVGLKEVVTQRKIERARAKAILRAAAGEFAPPEEAPPLDVADIINFLEHFPQKPDTGVKATIIPFPRKGAV